MQLRAGRQSVSGGALLDNPFFWEVIEEHDDGLWRACCSSEMQPSLIWWEGAS